MKICWITYSASSVSESERQIFFSNRYAYAFFMVLVVYLAIKGDYEWAVTNFCIAVVFDPFDQTVKWKDRPLYQKAWLLVHAAVMVLGLILIFFQKH